MDGFWQGFQSCTWRLLSKLKSSGAKAIKMYILYLTVKF
jgi:hypothetical protein